MQFFTLLGMSDEELSSQELAGTYVLRYLRTLTSWVSATQYLFSSRYVSSFKTMAAVLIKLTEHDGDRSEALASLRSILIQHCEQYSGEVTSAALQWLEDRINRTQIHRCHVHAEAGLMALASAVRFSGQSYGRIINSVFLVGFSYRLVHDKLMRTSFLEFDRRTSYWSERKVLLGVP